MSAMAYDKQSFLAGVAVGRNMRSMPIREHTEAPNVFRFTLWIDQTQTSRNFTCVINLTGKISWGDGQETELTASGTGIWYTHTYLTDGVFHVTIIGDLYALGFTSGASYTQNPTLITVDTPYPPLPASLSRPRYFSIGGLFSGCVNLLYVPQNFLQNIANDDVYIDSLDSMFSMCQHMSYLPDGFFSKVKFRGSGVSAANLFYSCSALRALPSDLFDNEQRIKITSTYRMCKGCTSLRTLPDGLFDNIYGVTTAEGMFSGCTSLTALPRGLLDNFDECTNFAELCSECESLQTIPNGLFANSPNVTTFCRVFYVCYALHDLPSGLFAGKSRVTTFEGAFAGCWALTSVSEDTFYGCSSVTSIRLIFNAAGILTIPSGIFASMVNLTDAYMAFYTAWRLTALPSGLFANNTLVTEFGNLCAWCTALTTIGSGVFDNLSSEYVGFWYAFEGCSAITSAVPELWLTFTTGNPGRGCYTGCTAAANYNDIPTTWR